jgi:pyruvate/oxaloacetate carboxyltransferase
VRAEIGYPIMVTPFSQFVGVQATFNVIQGERYATVPHELYLYAIGQYGASPGPIDPDVLDRILKGKSVDKVDHTACLIRTSICCSTSSTARSRLPRWSAKSAHCSRGPRCTSPCACWSSNWRAKRVCVR